MAHSLASRMMYRTQIRLVFDGAEIYPERIEITTPDGQYAGHLDKVSQTRYMYVVLESFQCLLSAAKPLAVERKDGPLMFHTPFFWSKSYFIRMMMY